MGKNPHANGGLLLKDLIISDYVFSHLESAIIESINIFVIPLF